MAASSSPAVESLQFHVDADLKRRTEEFLATNPVLSKKLDDLDRLLVGHFLQTQLQDERNGWRGTMAKAIDEVERHRKLRLKADTGGEEYKMRRQFTDFMDSEDVKDSDAAATASDAKAADSEEANGEAVVRLQAELAEARDEASAAAELTWHYENFIRELKAINTKLEARLTQLMQERRRCLKLLPPPPGGPEGADLYKAIRLLQNRHEQKALEQADERDRLVLAHAGNGASAAASSEQYQQHHQRLLCAVCGTSLSSPTPHSDGQPQPQPQAGKRGSYSRVFSRPPPPPPADIAIVPLRPPQWQQQQQPPQQEPPPADPDLQERLSEAQVESGRLRKDLHALAKALRAAESDAREKAERLAAYEKQVASMKHAFTYRQQQQQQQQQPAVTESAAADSSSGAAAAGSSLPALNLRHTHKRPSQHGQQQPQQPLSDRAPAGLQHHVMPAKTSVTRCLRCQKLYRLVDNNKFACKYHAKGRQRREQHNSQGKLADVLFVWDCCGRLANAEGCCYSEHI